jgi:hypothetical protein
LLGLGSVPNHNGGDGSFAGSRVEARFFQALLKIAGIGPKLLYALGLILEEIKGGKTGSRDGWRLGTREDKWPCR